MMTTCHPPYQGAHGNDDCNDYDGSDKEGVRIVHDRTSAFHHCFNKSGNGAFLRPVYFNVAAGSARWALPAACGCDEEGGQRNDQNDKADRIGVHDTPR